MKIPVAQCLSVCLSVCERVMAVEADAPRLPDGVSVDNDNSDQKVACVTLSHSLSAVGSPAGGEVGQPFRPPSL